MKYLIVVFCFLILFKNSIAQIPSVEMRGVWVASISNLDWPSSNKLSVKEQKNEVLSILNFYEQHNFNCVFLQVRPSADVLYRSKLEPWSKSLTGKQGVKPKYDPLKFWIKEAHKRNIELHAWINPYRIANSEKEFLSEKHPAVKNPDWIVNYGGKVYYNPALKQCRNHIKNIVTELIHRYDVDGIHFDDYFYPYPVRDEEFPDSLNFTPYKRKFKSIEDWRRDNVTKTIKELQRTIKSIKPYIQFGVSPFGVWRNQKDDPLGSITNAGVTNYDDLYANVYQWMQKGWIDYVIPQIYWSRNNGAVPFDHLTNWWSRNSNGTNVYIGHAVYKMGNGKKDWEGSDEMIHQIEYNRNDSLTQGSVYFRHEHLKQNKFGFSDSLRNTIYAYPALVPSINHNSYPTPYPIYKLVIKKDLIKWKYKNQKDQYVKSFAIYAIYKGGEKRLIKIVNDRKVQLSELNVTTEKLLGIQITAVNRFDKESTSSNIIWLSGV